VPIEEALQKASGSKLDQAIEKAAQARSIGSDANFRVHPTGVPEYQAANDCPKCMHHGKRFAREGNKYTKCRECDTKIAIASASPNGFAVPDEAGNNFYGNQEYMISREAAR
jgi:ribosomal protein L37AE/L43A